MIRFSPNSRDNAFVTLPNMHQDAIIFGSKDQNRALEGDIVLIELYPQTNWKKVRVFKTFTETPIAAIEEGELTNSVFEAQLNPTSDVEETTDLERPYDSEFDVGKLCPEVLYIPDIQDVDTNASRKLTEDAVIEQEFPLAEEDVHYEYQLQPTGRVVRILKSNRATSFYPGTLLLHQRSKSRKRILFKPSDSRLPQIYVPWKHCTSISMKTIPLKSQVFAAQIYHWPSVSRYPLGGLSRSLGRSGEIDTETQSILLQTHIDDSPFGMNVLACLPSSVGIFIKPL